jgi:hypothetical protein
MVKLNELSLKRRDDQQAKDAGTTLEPKGTQQDVLIYPWDTRIQLLPAERQNLSHLISYLWETWQARKLLQRSRQLQGEPKSCGYEMVEKAKAAL